MFSRSVYAGIVFLLFIFAIQSTQATTTTCDNVPVDANTGIWLATRQQYDPSYVPPVVQNVVAHTDVEYPAWVAVRQQYEIGFVPSIDPTFRPIVNANSPRWLAVRQQYETTYVPPQVVPTQLSENQVCV